MAEPRGRPKTLVRRHVLEIKKDTREWIVDQLDAFTDRRTFGKTGRVIGAGIAAAGIYVMIRLINEFGRGVVDAAKDLQTDIFTGVSIPVVNVFTSLFGISVTPAGEKAKAKVHEDITTSLGELGGFDPFAFGAALTAGGMVLAGLNPGEILKGIGSIIDALIPL